MGSSPRARIAWAVDFGDPENTCEGFDWDEAGVDSYDFKEDVMPGLFGFTEEPPEWPDGLEIGSPEGRAWWEANRKPYNERLEAAVPLKFEHYGYEYGGTALVLKRSYASVEWGAEAIDPATLAVPSTEELAAFAMILDRLGYDGGAPKLLLMSMYG